MRIHATILALVGSLLIVPSAGAYQKPSGTFCKDYASGPCYTTQPADKYQLLVQSGMGRGWGYLNTGMRRHVLQSYGCYYMYSSMEIWRLYGSQSSNVTCVYVGGDYVTHIFEQYPFPDIPAQDIGMFEPTSKLTISQLWSGGEKVQESFGISDTVGSSISAYCSHFSARDNDKIITNNVALDRTPDSIMSACGFTVRKSQYVPLAPPTTDQNDDTTTTDDVVIPDDSTRCGAVNNGSERVSVRSSRHSCNEAKNILRSYSRSLRSPRGWSCKASMNDARFKARCSKKTNRRARTRAAVYGIWIRR